MNDTQTSKQLELLKCITQHKAAGVSAADTDISSIDILMNTYLPEILYRYPDIHTKLVLEYERFKEYINYKELAKKNVIALGGKFGTGKSSFFNSIYGTDILPCDINAYTSVPTYIICENSSSSYMLNKFDFLIRTEQENMQEIFNGFKKSASDLFVPMGHLIKSALIHTSYNVLKNTAFLDTPGYSEFSEKDYCDKTDKSILTDSLNHSNYILWFADINNCSISESDICILKKINPHIPKLIIINKADILSASELNQTAEKTKKILDSRSVQYIDILTYSNNSPEKYDKYKILAYFDRWNKTSGVINFTHDFGEILQTLKKIGEDKNISEFEEFKNQLIKEVEKTSRTMYKIESVFQVNSSDGFVSLDSISIGKNNQTDNKSNDKSSHNISMDISKFKLSEIPVSNPEKLLRNYNDINVTDNSEYERYINSVSIMLTDNMKNIEPLFSRADGSAAYAKEISKIIAQSFDVDMTDNTPVSETVPDKNETDKNDSDEKNRSKNRSSRTSPFKKGADKQNENSKDISEQTQIKHERPAPRPPRRSLNK